jgi:hypothetical protein
MQDYCPQLFCFTYLRKNRGMYPSKNVGAPTFSLSFLPIPTLSPLSFQSFAHSFIFRITPIRSSSNSFRTLSPKTGGVSPLVRPIPTVGRRPFPILYLLYVPYFLYLRPFHSPPIHNPVIPPSPILLTILSQCSPVRGPTHTPCLPSIRGLRYTATDAIRPARSAHETRFNH